jgi:Zn-finger nucleic acid-binding protein
MLCPVCKETELRITDRQGIEIDYCPQCRGVWLDRGELDKLIERAQQEYSRPQVVPAAAPPPAAQPRYQEPRYEKRRDHDDDDDYYRRYGKRRKKGGWLEDLLDFD